MVPLCILGAVSFHSSYCFIFEGKNREKALGLPLLILEVFFGLYLAHKYLCIHQAAIPPHITTCVFLIPMLAASISAVTNLLCLHPYLCLTLKLTLFLCLREIREDNPAICLSRNYHLYWISGNRWSKLLCILPLGSQWYKELLGMCRCPWASDRDRFCSCFPFASKSFTGKCWKYICKRKLSCLMSTLRL
jgi:hypothetical protein